MFICNHDYKSAREHFIFSVSRITTSVLLGMLVFFISRILFLGYFDDTAQFKSYILSYENFFDYFSLILRMDFKWVITIHIPILAFAVLFCFRVGVAQKFKKVCNIYSTVAFLIFLISAVSNFYYYKTYDRYIDPFMFGFFREDFSAVLETVIRDYPVVLMLVSIVLLTTIYHFVYNFISNKIERCLQWLPTVSSIRNKGIMICLILILLSIVGVGARGALGVFPLRESDISISKSKVIINSIPNGVAAFYWAYNKYSRELDIPEISAKDVLKVYKKMGIETKDVFSPLLRHTKKNDFLSEHKPNVVVSIMESMSTHMLTFDDENSLDLYGALRKHTKEDYYSTSFISEGNGTIESITAILLSIPDLNFSTSSRYTRSVITNTIRPYKDQGYKVLFITSGKGEWRNLTKFLLSQGVDEVISSTYLEELYPNVVKNVWGVDDAAMFDLVLKKLQSATEPTLIFTLSVVNHPPFAIPDPTQEVLQLNDKVLKRFYYDDTADIMGTLKYANNELGKFIAKVKQDKVLGNNTFIAATGDHNIRGIGYSNYLDESLLGYSVPIYFYVPEFYKEHDSFDFAEDKVFSQKDIMSTLINHTLSDVDFYTFGCDMFAGAKDTCLFPYALNYDAVATNVDKDKNVESYVCYKEKKMYGFKSAGFEVSNLLVDVGDTKKYDCNKVLSLIYLEKAIYYYQMQHNKE